jgi:hypothetical protein
MCLLSDPEYAVVLDGSASGLAEQNVRASLYMRASGMITEKKIWIIRAM